MSKTAQASTANEGDFGGDFGNDFASETLLPIDTDVVNGNVSGGGDIDDFISLQDLLPGSFTISATHDAAPNYLFISQLDDDGNFVAGANDGGDGDLFFEGTIPSTGNLHFNISAEGEGSTYIITLLPEPSAAALLGGGLLAAAALRRVRARNRS